MPLMTKIRESLGTFFLVFSVVFVAYMVLDWGMDITGRRRGDRTQSQEIGKINGHEVFIKDFTDLVRRASDNQKSQTGSEPNDEQIKSIRDQVWNQLVDETLYDEQIKRFGITVTDQEIIDWVRGNDPPAFLKQQFTDSTGTFNRQAYDATIMDPKNKEIMVRVEDGLRKQREREKLQSLIVASVQADENDIRQRFIDQTMKFNADYLFFDPNVFAKDENIKVTDDDLRQFYNEHSDEFKVEATRKLKYVVFNNIPSHGDSASVLSDLEDVQKRATAGADFLELAKQESETPISDTYYKHGDLPQERENAIFSASEGDILGPIQELDGYHLIKVLEFRTGTAGAVHASHILISIENNDSAKALTQARDVLAQAKSGKDFAALAMQYSKDPGSQTKGGDLGWFGKGKMVPPFEDAAFKANTGQIVGPIRTPFGYHIIKILAKDNREVKIADIHLSVHIGSQTQSDISQQAQDFSYITKQGSFEKEAQQSKYKVQETLPFQKDAVVPGLGLNNAINKFAFNNKSGSISDPITVQNGSAVLMVSEVKEAGMRSFDEVKPSLDARVKREKEIEKTKTIVAGMRQSLTKGDSLGKIIRGYAGIPDVQHCQAVTLGGFIPGVGHDMSFIGSLSKLQPGEISNPIEGQRGIYLIQLQSKTPFDSAAYVTQRETLRSQLLSEKRNLFLSQWTDELKKKADIVDNRDVFYRE